MHTKVAANIKKAQKHYKKGYDERNNTSFVVKIGDQVLLRNKKNAARQGGKMESKFFKDVYIVVRVHENGNVNVKNSKSGVELAKTFPPDQIKKYLEPISTHMLTGPDCHAEDFVPDRGCTPVSVPYPNEAKAYDDKPSTEPPMPHPDEPRSVSKKLPTEPLLNSTAINEGKYMVKGSVTLIVNKPINYTKMHRHTSKIH